MSGGHPWTPAEDAALRDLGPAHYPAWADAHGHPKRGTAAISRRDWHVNGAEHRKGKARLTRLPDVSPEPRRISSERATRRTDAVPDPYALDPDPTPEPTPVRGRDGDDRLFAFVEEPDGDPLPLMAALDRSFPPEPIGICFVGDVHAGAGGVEYRRFREDMETIARTDGLHAVGMGDYIENTKPQSKSGTALYDAAFANPDKQLRYAETRMAICKEKWLALAEGNHDSWDYKQAGLRRIPGLAAGLGADYFSEAGGLLRLRVGQQRYAVMVKHEHAGSSRLSKGNAQRRAFNEWPWSGDAPIDVICLAHLHEPYMEQRQERGREVTFLRCGTYKTRDGWSEAKGYRPACGVPMVVLYPGERKIVAFSGARFADGVRFLDAERRRTR